MGMWRRLMIRLSRLHGGRMLRALAPLLVLVLLVGCGGGLRHESWPGLSIVDDTLYVANLERVEAIDAETGKVYWTFPDAEARGMGPFYAAPVPAPDEGEHGVLLAAGFDRTVYALALGDTPAERPDELWRFSEAGGQYVATGTVTEDLYIIGNGDGRVYALRLEDGSKAWEFATRDRVWTTPVVVEDTVYVASLDHHLYALDVETGDMQWQLETEGSIATTPVYAGGDLWIGDFASQLYQVDLESQEVVWTFTADNWLWATPVFDGSVLYFADVGGQVYALDIESHTLVWDEPVVIDDAVHGQPALSEDHALLFVAGYEKGGIHAIDVNAGALRGSWGTPSENPGRLPGDLVADEEHLYAMPILVSERVQAFDLAAGELVWSVPQAEE